jgi:hypothetical protein
MTVPTRPWPDYADDLASAVAEAAAAAISAAAERARDDRGDGARDARSHLARLASTRTRLDRLAALLAGGEPKARPAGGE